MQKIDLITKKRVKKTFILELTKKGLELYDELEKVFDHLNNKFKKKVSKEKIALLTNTFKEVNKDLGISNDESIMEGDINESCY